MAVTPYQIIIANVLDDIGGSLYSAAMRATDSIAGNLDKVADAFDDSRGGRKDDKAEKDEGDLIMSRPTFDSIEACRARDARLYTAIWRLCKRLMKLPPQDRKVAVRLMMAYVTQIPKTK